VEVDFLDFQYLTTEFGLAKNSKTKVEKVFFFIFLSSCPEMSFFFGPKISEKIRDKNHYR
jgi:hypothetical protein